jgi:acetyl-CoA carboxylase carboxyltransferase component
MSDHRLKEARERALAGGPERHRRKAAEQGKLPVRERLALLLDPDSLREDYLLAAWEEEGMGADGVICGFGSIGGRPAAVVANDPTVKAGSWGPRTVEKILRLQEAALDREVPLIYLVDSAGARITEQLRMFAGRRGAGRIFYNQVRLSGVAPQLCLLFGPSAAGGAYIPAFCDVVIMHAENGAMYLGSPRMAEVVIGERVTLAEMGGAGVHAEHAGTAHLLGASDQELIELAKRCLSFLPTNWREQPPPADSVDPELGEALGGLVPQEENRPFEIRDLIRAIVDGSSWFELHERFAPEVVVGFARLGGRAVGVVANQPLHKGGVLFCDSADKAARFIWTCNAYNLPLLFLADVPGFMIGTKVEREGIIRHGAKLIAAVSEATVPKICVVVRKAYGAGLYAMAGPAFGSDGVLALPGARIAVMGADPAVNAVYYNELAAIPDPSAREERRKALRDAYEREIDVLHLAGELIVDAVVEPTQLRRELIGRFEQLAPKDPDRTRESLFPRRRNPVTPV